MNEIDHFRVFVLCSGTTRDNFLVGTMYLNSI
jgi:hypothetical protein